MHETVESAFRFQRDTGGVIGPEGPDWPRIKATEEGQTYLNGLPESVRILPQLSIVAAASVSYSSTTNELNHVARSSERRPKTVFFQRRLHRHQKYRSTLLHQSGERINRRRLATG
jgi:hypothetical protein